MGRVRWILSERGNVMRREGAHDVSPLLVREPATGQAGTIWIRGRECSALEQRWRSDEEQVQGQTEVLRHQPLLFER